MFVDNAAGMVVDRDLDHRYYEYPGLLFQILAVSLGATGTAAPVTPASYVVARGVVGLFGVASVYLAWCLARKAAAPAAALLAALLVAVSPLEVKTAHMVRPDVVLETFSLLALFALQRLDGRLGRDLAAGAALGAAVAVKFSGVLLVPAYVVALGVGAGGRDAMGHRLLRAGAVAAVAAGVFFATTPAALLHPRAFLAGVAVQYGYHYDVGASGAGYPAVVGAYLAVLGDAVGRGLWLVPVGLLVRRREWRAWLPLLVFPATAVAVYSTSEALRDRFLVPCVGAMAVLVAISVDGIGKAAARRAGVRPGGIPATAAAVAFGAGAAALLAGPPLLSSLRWMTAFRTPTPWDRALDALEGAAPPGSVVASGIPDLGLDRRRWTVLDETGDNVLDLLLAEQSDWVVTPPGRPVPPGFVPVLVAGPSMLRPAIAVFRGSAGRPRPYVPVPLELSQLAASENAGALGALLDGDARTSWSSSGPQRAGQWIEIDLGPPTPLGIIELDAGTRSRRASASVRVEAWDGAGWRAVRTVAGNPLEPPGPFSDIQALLIEPVLAARVRIVQQGSGRRRWGVAELRLGRRAAGTDR